MAAVNNTGDRDHVGPAPALRDAGIEHADAARTHRHVVRAAGRSPAIDAAQSFVHHHNGGRVRGLVVVPVPPSRSRSLN
ncbi:MAG: hypothetical protein ACLPVY_09670, partial [Acidimicrobiia bacterium]